MKWLVIQFLGYAAESKEFSTYEEAKAYYDDDENFLLGLNSNRLALVQVLEERS